MDKQLRTRLLAQKGIQWLPTAQAAHLQSQRDNVLHPLGYVTCDACAEQSIDGNVMLAHGHFYCRTCITETTPSMTKRDFEEADDRASRKSRG